MEPRPVLIELRAADAAEDIFEASGSDREGDGNLGRVTGISRKGEELSQTLKASSIL